VSLKFQKNRYKQKRAKANKQQPPTFSYLPVCHTVWGWHPSDTATY